MTTGEVAKLIGRSTRHTFRLIKQGKIIAKKVGKYYDVSKKAVTMYLNKRKQEEKELAERKEQANELEFERLAKRLKKQSPERRQAFLDLINELASWENEEEEENNTGDPDNELH